MSTPRTRTRKDGLIGFTSPNRVINLGHVVIKALSGSTTGYDVNADLYNLGHRFSLSQYCQDELHPGPPYKVGGPLDIVECQSEGSTIKSNCQWAMELSGKEYSYTGGFICGENADTVFGSYDYDNIVNPINGSLTTDVPGNEWGKIREGLDSEAWHRFKPGQPVADLAVFLGEIKEVPRMLATSAKAFHRLYKALRSGKQLGKKLSKQAAEHHLNTQFGWLPFVSDLRKFYYLYKTLDKQVHQLIKDNGQWIKRAGVVETDSMQINRRTGASTKHYPTLGSAWHVYGVPYGNYTVTTSVSQRTWFAARFKYWIPNIRSPYFRADAIRHLFGLRVSPSVVWNLIPWSWLVDWFADIGGYLANNESGIINNLAAKYAYIMSTTRLEGLVDSTYSTRAGSTSATWKFTLSRKIRNEASPFGFGLTSDDFTARQYSLLGALGLSRLR